MNILWGILMLLIGLFLFVSAFNKSSFIIYRLFLERSRILWGDNAHTFLLVVGLILMSISSMFFLDIW